MERIPYRKTYEVVGYIPMTQICTVLNARLLASVLNLSDGKYLPMTVKAILFTPYF
jgi:hypothetical protein